MLNVFITGASSGIGAALAREFAARGATLGLVARNPEKLAAVIATLPGDQRRYLEDLDVLEEVYRTNVFAMANTFHPFIEPMRRRGGGQLVGIGSVAGIRGLPGSEAYCASKSAVITYCESLRVSMAKYGIRVSTVCPAFVKTPLTAKNPYKMPFILEPDEFARRAADAIAARKSYVVIPWQMGILAKIMRLLPDWLFDKIVSNRKQKPRKKDL